MKTRRRESSSLQGLRDSGLLQGISRAWAKTRRCEDTKTRIFRASGLREPAELERRHEESRRRAIRAASGSQQSLGEATKTRRHEAAHLQGDQGCRARRAWAKTRRCEDTKTRIFRASGLQGLGRRHEDTKTRIFTASGLQGVSRAWAKTRRHEDTHLQGFRASGSQKSLSEHTKTRRCASSGRSGLQ